MIIASASEVSKSFGAETILKGISFHVNEGDRIGVIGNNGAGKSTLLSLLSGTGAHDLGSIYISSKISLGYLQQNNNFTSGNTVYEEMLSIFSELIALEDRIQELTLSISQATKDEDNLQSLLSEYDDLSEQFKSKRGFSYRSEIRGMLSSMAFTEDYYNKKISTLSGGERTRLALASLLLQKPDLLLLDEPTNHLDMDTLKWLEQFLESYPGTLIIVSHDRYFLDKTVKRIFEIDRSTLSIFEGNYTAYVRKKKQLEKDVLKEYDNKMREIERQEDMIRRLKQHGTEKLAKRARSRERSLRHIERPEHPSKAKKPMKLIFKEKYKSGKDVLSVADLSMSFWSNGKSKTLFTDIDIDIKRGERICLLGPNGIGKTTLLNVIMGKFSPDAGYVRFGQNVEAGYYDQQQALLKSDLTVIEELHESFRLYTETEIRGLLGRFNFHGDDVFKNVRDLSGGERAKLSLLKLMLSGANLLIMDEPTNHLDIDAKEAFENAVLDFPGTSLIVSHDRYLLNKIPTRIIELSGSGIKEYLGTYDYYLEKKQPPSPGINHLKVLNKAEQKPDNEKEVRALARKKQKKEEAEQRRREREISSAEKEIERLEEEILCLEKEMCKEEVFSDHSLAASYSQKLDEAKADLLSSYAYWEQLHE